MSLPHLHVHSSYSFLEGLAAPQELVQAAVQHAMPALALCDHNRLTGAIEFYDACRAAGIQPIIGMSADVSPPPGLPLGPAAGGTLTLLACDLRGWAGLCRLSSALHAQAGEAQPLDWATLAGERSGLICLTGGVNGPVTRTLAHSQATAAAWLERLKALFPQQLYVELQVHRPDDLGRNLALHRLARGLNLPYVATHSIYYLTNAQAALQRTVSAIRLNRSLGELGEQDVAPPRASFLSPGEMQQRFGHDPTALVATLEIAARCRLELPLGQPHFPQLELPDGQSAIQVLRQRAERGLQHYYPQAQPQSAPALRLEHELQVIETCGYESLFLVMQEIIAFAQAQAIPMASRGSASSSLVAHCLGITTPDPMRLKLYFERFLNPARSSPPDIDTDLCSRRRDEVLDFVYRRFGAERVAMVCTISRFRRRSALRDVAKAYGLPPAQISQMAGALPQRWYGPAARTQADDDPYAELRGRFNSELQQQILRDAAALRGIPRHLSVHPGGIVIAPGPITDLSPTQMASKGLLITQFDLDAIERLGLVKLDLLGIRGLTVLGDVAQALRQPNSGASSGAANHGGASHDAANIVTTTHGAASHGDANPGITIHSNANPAGSTQPGMVAAPEDDTATADLVEHGHTIGCFQIESPGMRATLREIHARTPDDILAALALYRPGPLTGGLKDAFVARYRRLEAPQYLHPALEPLLGDTFGVVLYQEQVLRIAHELAGLSLADADLLRRAMSHFDPGKKMQQLQERFIAGALAHSGVPPAAAQKIWELMAAFAGYGFPKAHAASYAQVAWQSAWCKQHHPALFLAAVLANWGGYYGQRVYLAEARRLGLSVRPPQINYAQPEFSVSYLDGQPVLFMGLNQVRELTQRTQARLLHARPFQSLADFILRVDPRRQEAENLIRAGALAGMGRIPDLLRQAAQVSGRSRAGGHLPGQLSLFDSAAEAQDWSLAEQAAAQEAVLGISLVAHPLELHARQVAAAQVISTVEAAARLGQSVRVAGVRHTWRRSIVPGGEALYFMALEDLEGMLDVVISAGLYRQARHALSGPGPYVIEGQVAYEAEHGEPFIRAIKIEGL